MGSCKGSPLVPGLLANDRSLTNGILHEPTTRNCVYLCQTLWSWCFGMWSRKLILETQKIHTHCLPKSQKWTFIISSSLNPKYFGQSASHLGSINHQANHSHKPKAKIPISSQLVLNAPAQIQPYLKLSRVDAPIGTWLLFWPCTWGLTIGSTGIPDWKLLGLFGLGAFIMRGAGCTINDMWDRRIDSSVSRTRERPLASGQLRLRHAAAWCGAQLTPALLILLSLPAPCLGIGITSLGLVVLYPLAKRFTNWPQGVLGLTFNIGIIMGYTAAIGSGLGYLELPWLSPSLLSLYGAAVSWTLIYDTIYAHQDREEDSYLGLGSTARKFGTNTHRWLTGFSGTMITGLTVTGLLEGFGWPWYLGVLATGAHLSWQIHTLDINNRENCAHRFRSNRHIGWIIFLSLLLQYELLNNNKSNQTQKAESELEIKSRKPINSNNILELVESTTTTSNSSDETTNFRTNLSQQLLKQ